MEIALFKNHLPSLSCVLSNCTQSVFVVGPVRERDLPPGLVRSDLCMDRIRGRGEYAETNASLPQGIEPLIVYLIIGL